MNRNRLIIAALVVIILMIGLTLVLFFGNRPRPAAPPSPSPTPTADPFAAERPIVVQLSKDFAGKYQTFASSDSPAYFASIKPYLTASLFEQTRQESARYAGRVPFLQPVRSSATGATVQFTDGSHAAADVTVASVDLKTGKPFTQELVLSWQKTGTRWTITNITTTKYTKS